MLFLLWRHNWARRPFYVACQTFNLQYSCCNVFLNLCWIWHSAF